MWDLYPRRQDSRASSDPGRERGASLVEFALIAPLLLLLLLGIVEFGYLFGQFNEVRHAAREGARYAAVSNPDRDGGGVGNSDVVDAVCESLNLSNATIAIDLAQVDANGNVIGGDPDRGDYAKLTVSATIQPLSGAPLVTSFLPSSLTNEATFRLEQDSAWSPFTGASCP